MAANSTESKARPLLQMRGAAIPDLHDPQRIAVRDVNWEVSPGDYWAIGGLHSSGKSNFIFAVAGVLPPVEGTYLAFGTELTPGYEHGQLSPRLRIGTVFDGGRLLHHLSIAENIGLPFRYHRNLSLAEAASVVEPLLDFVGLAKQAGSLPGSIGRSRQQRAGLARALILKPEVLLLDTPLSGLDPREMIWWLDTLDRLAAGHPLLENQPLTIVVTTDDLRPWANRARQFAVLRNKRLAILRADEAARHASWHEEEPT